MVEGTRISVIFHRTATAMAAACILAMTVQSATAQNNGQKPWSVSGSLGVQYNDNVTTDETDTTSNQSDKSLQLELGGLYKPKVGEKYGLELGYDFSQSIFEDLTDFNLQSHALSMGIEREYSGIDTSLTYLYVHTFLGGDNFLGLHSLTPSVGYSVNDFWYASGRYSYQNKDFKSAANNNRDSDVNSFTLDNFLFFMEGKGFVSLGYRIEGEDTQDIELDYLGHYFHARIKSPIPVNSLERWKPTVTAGYEYFKKDYSDITASIGAKREDERTTLKLGLSADITEHVKARLDYERIEAISNLSSSDFDENSVMVSLGFQY
ncbi:MAG: outer membrane beta-barrel protein [Rhodospirillaceae bacterium]|jgi:hypothetical protein|nr:outer membrane beta-barrel protein [Rhodospirillaceae bacterium]MBT5458502.1 outer membrane beta-barrel protein [Rhodospirillaceae bacterium]